MTVPALDARAGGARRAPILVVVIGLVAAGIIAGRAHSVPAEPPTAPVDAAQTAPSGALTSAWYCPGLPAQFPNRDQTVTLSNLGSAASDAVVTVHPDDGSDPVIRTISVPGNTVRSFSRVTLAPVARAGGGASPKADAARLPAGPIVVEPLSPAVVVEAGVETDDKLALTPCATTLSADWYFAAGTTVRGVAQWLVLDNPTSTDARVNVEVRSEVGLRLLPELQGVDVPGRSRVVIAVQDQAVRQERVAIAVHADVGRVVAAQTLQFGPASGSSGVASTLGVLAPAKRWWFTDGRVVADSTQLVAIANLGPIDTQVIVQALTADSRIVTPVSITVPADGVRWVTIGNCHRGAKDCLQVPENRGYQLIVSDAQVPVIAQTLSRFGGDTGSLGATTSMGSTVAGRRWVIPRTRVTAQRSTSISVLATGLDAAHLDIDVVHGGRVERPDALEGLTVDGGARLVLPASALPDTDAAVVIESDQPIVVESTIYAANDATRGPGVPSR